MCEKRLKAFEKMLADVLLRYDSTTEKMAELKAEGREKTAILLAVFRMTILQHGQCIQGDMDCVFVHRNHQKTLKKPLRSKSLTIK